MSERARRVERGGARCRCASRGAVMRVVDGDDAAGSGNMEPLVFTALHEETRPA